MPICSVTHTVFKCKTEHSYDECSYHNRLKGGKPTKEALELFLRLGCICQVSINSVKVIIKGLQ